MLDRGVGEVGDRVDGAERDRPVLVEAELSQIGDDHARVLARDVAHHEVAVRPRRRRSRTRITSIADGVAHSSAWTRSARSGGRDDPEMDHRREPISEACARSVAGSDGVDSALRRGIRNLRLSDPGRCVVFRPTPTVALRTHVPFDDRQPTEQALAPSAGARGHGYGPGVRNAG